MGLNDGRTPLQAPRFRLEYPSSWTQSTDANGTVTIAPKGAAGSFGVAYGVVMGIEKQSGNGVADASGLASATTALVQGGTAVAERDWLVTVARPDGDMSYMVFVSPERDFATMKPVFDGIVASFRPQ